MEPEKVAPEAISVPIPEAPIWCETCHMPTYDPKFGSRCKCVPQKRAGAAAEPVGEAPKANKLLPCPWKWGPDAQGYWWHWTGHEDDAPHMYSVMSSGMNGKYFIAYPDSRWCETVGGLWMRVVDPTSEQMKEAVALWNQRK